jgi:hypothetical protein
MWLIGETPSGYSPCEWAMVTSGEYSKTQFAPMHGRNLSNRQPNHRIRGLQKTFGEGTEGSEAGFRPFAFENGLVNLMINEAGDRLDQLPLLQHALMRTWKCAVLRAESNGSVVRLIHDDYSGEAGGIENALSRHADAAWNTIKDDPKKSAVARRLFLLLCDVSPDGQIIRRRPKVAEVQAVTGAAVPEIEEVVRLFQDDDRNFLLPQCGDDFSSETYLDISHEALLRQWQRFASEWLVQERSDAEELRRLAQQASLRRQGKGGFIGRDDLHRVLRWKDGVSEAWALRYITKDAWVDVLAYIDESVAKDKQERDREARSKAILRRIVWIVIVIGTIISVIFGVMARRAEERANEQAKAAEKARNAAEEALTRSFLRTIGVSDRSEPSADERDALWELAELDAANEDVRRMVIDRWLENDDIDLLMRPLRNDFKGLHAVIGLNAALTTYWSSRANDALGHLAKVLESTPETDSNRLSSLGEILSALAARMNPDDAAPLADRLAKALESSPETDSKRLSSLGETLSALAARMNPDDAAPLAARGAAVIAKALESTPQTDSKRLSSLGETLLALAAPFPQESSTQLLALSNMSLQRILNPQEKGPEEPSMRKTFQTGCAQLRPRDLAEVLKWPRPDLRRGCLEVRRASGLAGNRRTRSKVS